ncbi:MAG TPA: SIMPL domain-containing protein [Mycobacteriales bacterium]|nr:SIMPL domain-containing protein [Mycobacteriales bacterium]
MDLTRLRHHITRTVVATTLAVGGLGIASTAPAFAAADDNTNDTVSVSGHGSVKGTPDTLISHFKAHTKRASTKDALDACGQVVTQVTDALKAEGVAASDIQTTGLTVGPTYNRHGKPTGMYRATEGLTAKMHPLDVAEKALDAAASAGGNSLRIGYSSLTILDKEKFRSEARAQAFENAKAAAEQYAELAGRQLGRAEQIVGNATGPSPEALSPPRQTALPNSGSAGGAAAPSSSVPVSPGKQKISASVDVVWALEDAPAPAT